MVRSAFWKRRGMGITAIPSGKKANLGNVTSCAIDAEGYLTGQGFIDIKSSTEGTPIAVYQGSPESTGKSPAQMTVGDRVILPAAAVVVSRFPKAPATAAATAGKS